MDKQSDLAVIIERLNNIKETNTKEHEAIKSHFEKVVVDHESRIKELEFWKVSFVAKFSVYSAIALAIGSIIGTIIVQLLLNWLH
jgi:hypothetical protein